jgi:hypothetical protein
MPQAVLWFHELVCRGLKLLSVTPVWPRGSLFGSLAGVSPNWRRKLHPYPWHPGNPSFPKFSALST